jgi:N-acetylglutamate synthase-like GNAT family acetyltransferase
MNFKIRIANPSEIEWVNSKYDEIGFQPASNKDLIAIAELENGEKIGLGRLVRLNENSLELAGIYVYESYRNKGAARKIIGFLMRHLNPSDKVYCLTYSKIKELYKQFGFIDCGVDENIPKPILDKCEWCEMIYKDVVDVIIFRR